MRFSEEDIRKLVESGTIELDQAVKKAKDKMVESLERLRNLAQETDTLRGEYESLESRRSSFEAELRARLTSEPAATLPPNPPAMPPPSPPPLFEIPAPTWSRLSSVEQAAVESVLKHLADVIVSKPESFLLSYSRVGNVQEQNEYLERKWRSLGRDKEGYIGRIVRTDGTVEFLSSKMSELLKPLGVSKTKVFRLLELVGVLDSRSSTLALKGDYTRKSPTPCADNSGVYRIRFGTSCFSRFKQVVAQVP